MLIIKGEVRKVLDDSYTDKKTGEHHQQSILVIEPPVGAQNYEVKLTRKQCAAKFTDQWRDLVGQNRAVAVTLYVNHQYKFHKFTAISGEPLPESL